MGDFAEAFAIDLEHGACVGVTVPAVLEAGALAAGFPPAELAHAAGLPPARRAEWLAGRYALRRAAGRVGVTLTGPVLPGPGGEPGLPAGFSGSISHKHGVAVGLAGGGTGRAVGVDLEDLGSEPRLAWAARVLTAVERAEWERSPEPELWAGLLTRFALKEAAYKALAPAMGRFIRFDEVEVELWAGGRARIACAFALPVGAGSLAGSWRLVDARWLVATVRLDD